MVLSRYAAQILGWTTKGKATSLGINRAHFITPIASRLGVVPRIRLHNTSKAIGTVRNHPTLSETANATSKFGTARIESMALFYHLDGDFLSRRRRLTCYLQPRQSKPCVTPII